MKEVKEIKIINADPSKIEENNINNNKTINTLVNNINEDREILKSKSKSPIIEPSKRIIGSESSKKENVCCLIF